MSASVIIIIQTLLAAISGILIILGAMIWMNYTLKEHPKDRQNCVLIGMAMILVGFSIVYLYDSLNKAGKLGFMVPVAQEAVKDKAKGTKEKNNGS